MNTKLNYYISLTLICLIFLVCFTGVVYADGRSRARIIIEPPPEEDQEPNWIFIKNFTTTVQIDAGEKYFLYFDNKNLEMRVMPDINLPTECVQALSMVPSWLKDNLTYKFRQLSPSKQVTYANLIINSPDPKYIDEIAFCIAHSSVESLEHQYMFPQLLTDNAKYTYQNDQYISYANIIEKPDYTTIRYYDADNVTHELPRDIYYWYVVHPKLSDELPTYVNPDYDYTSQPPGDRNYGVSPPTGKFWREWLFYHNDTGQNYTYPSVATKSEFKPNPNLKHMLSNATSVWEAISFISHWVVDSMIFDSTDERPIQPVRIYHKHMGRCGEHQDIACAAARAGLIPTTCTSNIGEDHVWNEFWDGRWVHWDANEYDHIDVPHDHDRDYSGFKDISSVWNARGDGHIWEVTGKYTPNCTLTIKVIDSNGLPVDGAEVVIATENYYDPTKLIPITWGSTDYTGNVSFDLGNDRNYFSAADTENLGEDPPDSGGDEQVIRVVQGSIIGGSYSYTFNLPVAAPELDPNMVELPDRALNKFKIEVDYNVDSNILQGINLFTREHYDLFRPSGDIDFLITNSSNFNKYNNSESFDAYEFQKRSTKGNTSFVIPDDDDWYTILSNEFSQSTKKIINITMGIYATLSVSIDSPEHGSEHALDSTVTITGGAFSPNILTKVEIDIDNNDNWQAVTDITNSSGSIYSKWKFDWNTVGLEPGSHNIRARVSDNIDSYITSINVTLIDITKPQVHISEPSDNSKFKIGEVIKITGLATDNVGIKKLEMILDSDSVNKTNIFSRLINNEWYYDLVTDDLIEGKHSITINASDAANNSNLATVQITLVESINPVVTINKPFNNSIFRHGDFIIIEGVATDNNAIKTLELIINDYEPINITSKLSRSGKWYYDWDTSEMNQDDSLYSIEIKAYDFAKNIGTDRIYIRIDGIVPNVIITNPVDAAIFNAGDKIKLEGTANDNYGIRTLEIILDNKNKINITKHLIDEKWSYNDLQTKDLHSGEHNISIRATDFMGWQSEATVFVTIDAKLPEVEIQDIAKVTLIGEIIYFEGTASDDIGVSKLELIIDISEPINLTTAYSASDETWDYVWNTSDVVEGTYTITVRVTDVVNKEVEDSVNVKLISYSTDSDLDGMPDWWEMQFDRLDPYKDDADLDYDKDGFTNLEEYLGDDGLPDNDDYSNPLDKDSVPYRKSDKPSKTGSSLSLMTFAIILIVIVIVILIILFIVLKKRKAGKEESKEASEETKRKQPQPKLQKPIQLIAPGFTPKMMPGLPVIPIIPPQATQKTRPMMFPFGYVPQPPPQVQQPSMELKFKSPQESKKVYTTPEMDKTKGKDKLKEVKTKDKVDEEDPLKFLAATLARAAVDKIDKAKEQGVDVSKAQKLLTLVLKELEGKNYDKAYEFAGRCNEEIEQLIEKKD